MMTIVNLNNKRFRSLSSSSNGEVDPSTIFHYRQKDDIIWATYEGGSVLFGTLSGRITDHKLEFTYQHQNHKGEFMTGKCTSRIELINDRIRLHEDWQWTCNDYSTGTSIIVEI